MRRLCWTSRLRWRALPIIAHACSHEAEVCLHCCAVCLASSHVRLRKHPEAQVWVRRVTARLRVLALVSRRWARIMRTSAVVWQRACIDLSEIVAQLPVMNMEGLCTDFAVMAAWFHARQGRVRQLGLRCTRGDVQLAPVMTGMLLSTQAASLRSLSINMTACGLRGHELGVIAALQGLTALQVHVSGHGVADRGLACLRTASRLPALAHLDFIYVQGEHIAPDVIGLPRCQELCELRSRSLTHVEVHMGCGVEDKLSLAGSSNLKDVRLFAPSSGRKFWMTPACFQGCTRMEELSLQYQRSLRLTPGCFNALSALTSLALADCGLLAVPAELAPLMSLRSLDLSRNQDLDVDETGSSVLRALKSMRTLDVAKYGPGTHSVTSVQALFDLVATFTDEGLPLRVNFNPALSAKYEAPTVFWGFP